MRIVIEVENFGMLQRRLEIAIESSMDGIILNSERGEFKEWVGRKCAGGEERNGR